MLERMDNILGFLSFFFFLISPGTAFNEFGKFSFFCFFLFVFCLFFFCKNAAAPELFLEGLIEKMKVRISKVFVSCLEQH